jgi:hypothetical protein
MMISIQRSLDTILLFCYWSREKQSRSFAGHMTQWSHFFVNLVTHSEWSIFIPFFPRDSLFPLSLSFFSLSLNKNVGIMVFYTLYATRFMRMANRLITSTEVTKACQVGWGSFAAPVTKMNRTSTPSSTLGTYFIGRLKKSQKEQRC